MNWLRLRHLAEYFAFRVVTCIADALPIRTAVWLAETAAWMLVHVLPKRMTRYKVARENLEQAFGDTLTSRQIDDLIYRMWVHLFRMVVEMVQLPRKIRLYNCAEVCQFRNRDESVRALCTGRPVMMLGGHFGNWEVANFTFGMFGFPLAVVARDLDNPYLDAWFRRYRKAGKHRLISKKGGGDAIVDMLSHRGIVGLLGDQDAGNRGLFVPFFGRPASTFKSIALLAIEYRAVICVGFARRLPDDWDRYRWVRYEVGCEEIIDPLELDNDLDVVTERYTAALERAVRRSPEQYFWVHRRWKTRPEAVKRQRKKVAA